MKSLLATPVDVPRLGISDYHPQAIGSDAACLHPLLGVGRAVRVPASSWAPAPNSPPADKPEVSIRGTATVTSPFGSLVIAVTAPPVIAAG